MAIVSSCPRCRSGFRLSEAQVGKKLRCKQCDVMFTVLGEEEEPAPREPQPRRRDDEDDRPSRRRGDERPAEGGGGGMGLMLGLGGGVFLLLLIGGVLYLAATSPTPQESTAEKELERPNDRATAPAFIPPPPTGSGGQASTAGQAAQPNQSPNQQANANPAPKNNPPAKKKADPAPKNAAAAAAMLRETNASRVRASLKWLAKAKIDDGQRDEVARAITPLLTNNAYKKDAMPAVARWATRENTERLLQFLNDRDAAYWRPAMEGLARIEDDTSVEAVVKQLSVAGREGDAARALAASPPRVAEKFLIPMLNSSRGNLSRDASRLLLDYKTPAGMLIDQTVEDLSSSDAGVKKNACAWLARTKADPEKQERVSRTLEGMMIEQDLQLRLAVIRALEGWGSKDSVSPLADALKNNATRDAAMRALLAIKADEVIPVLANHLNARERPLIAKALIGFGSKSERPTWVPLDRGDVETRRVAAEILGEVGTGDSVKILTKFAATEKRLGNLANHEAGLTALKKINDRKN